MRGAVAHPCIIHLPSHEHAVYKSDKLYDGTRPLEETVLTTQGIRTCALIAHGEQERAKSSDSRSFYARIEVPKDGREATIDVFIAGLRVSRR